MYGAAHVTGLEASRTLALLPAETVLQVPLYQLACPCLSPCAPLQNAQWQASALGDRSSSAAVPVWEVLSISVILSCF